MPFVPRWHLRYQYRDPTPDMQDTEIDHLRQRVRGSNAVRKLQSVSRDLLGGALLFLARRDDQVTEIHPSGNEEDLPEFCQLYRSSTNGLECCTACRSLMAFGTCYRGTLEYSCHGGVRILASPALPQAGSDTQLVVASCAFARPEHEEGWHEFRDHAQGLGIDLRKLRAAYDRMPVLTDDKRRIARALVEVAASLMNDLSGQATSGPTNPTAPQPKPPNASPAAEDLEQLMASALYLSQTQSAHSDKPPEGNLLVDRVQGMLSRHASMSFTLKNVARAAKVSPSHLSTLFHQVAGMTFSEFLLTQRIELAKRLLRDLSLNIEMVARHSGFTNASYFSRRFRQCTGKTPSEWRHTL